MKKIKLFIIVTFCCVFTAFSQEKTNTNGAEISFEKETHSFGSIIFGTEASYSFKFINAGSTALIISSVKSTCGCTIPYWPKEAIAPGDSAVVKIEYNTRRSGKFSKGVTIYSNAINSPSLLIITGEVTTNKNKTVLPN
ncbi:MAG: DUF1573 domain-containing protein [Bacteroidales bacterium]|nr:DUF1573 domain-containing protein [Bacteroidales bacterium]NLK81330.1 DUF1573 domain-containing protein [Bacteroidales bacterium]HPY83051.1 DUF1573 domain-containing protein [Bacteroidales bacterium]